ncbi:DUF2790 domain-containing protein [Stutzerimonas stutzeri]|uniref:DUF2790 domain-containing protein n=1 Tax=Stutzerimonas stutzeri TaxID=316 RepID=UPI0021092B01|nr:DUF2790 domain-containing protein [Stutzerimonas stutzeri]MCQ4321141.1 DUF2790 domain-containing protein [Stutzerimonas stutzeri]
MNSLLRTVLLSASLIAMSAQANSSLASRTQPHGYLPIATPAWLEHVPVERYAYGIKLDTDKVLRVSDVASVCGPVDATLHYRDSAGELRALRYRAMGGGCSGH